MKWHAMLCGIGWLLVSQTGTAETGDAPTAEALFRAGREASQQRDHATACQRFKESYRLDPAPGTLLNIATCEEQLGHLAEAWESYRHILETLPAGDDRTDLVRQHLSALEPRLPRLTLRLPQSPTTPSIEVSRDGVVLKPAALGVPLPLNPGEHHILVRAPQRQAREYIVVVAEAQQISLEIAPGDPVAPPSIVRVPVRVPTPIKSPPHEGLANALFGAGVAGLVAATFTGTLYLAASSTADDHCPTSSTCDDTGLKAAGRADGLQIPTYVIGAAGLAALGAGITLWAIDGSEASPKAVAWGIELGVGQAAVRGRF